MTWNRKRRKESLLNVVNEIDLPAAAAAASWCCLINKYFGRSSPAIISFCVNRRSGDVAWIDKRATWGTTGMVSSELAEIQSKNRNRNKEKMICECGVDYGYGWVWLDKNSISVSYSCDGLGFAAFAVCCCCCCAGRRQHFRSYTSGKSKISKIRLTFVVVDHWR